MEPRRLRSGAALAIAAAFAVMSLRAAEPCADSQQAVPRWSSRAISSSSTTSPRSAACWWTIWATPASACARRRTAPRMRRILAEQPADLVLLDINMPGEDGLSLARFLRANTEVGIVMLTAAGEVVDRVVGLEIGADDYIAKPVDLRELLARIRAVLRRLRTGPPQPAAARDARCQDDADRRLQARSRRAPAVRRRRPGGADHQHGVRPAEGVRRASQPGAQPRSAARSRPQQGLGAVRSQHRHPHRAAAAQDRGRPRASRRWSRPCAAPATSSCPRPEPVRARGPPGRRAQALSGPGGASGRSCGRGIGDRPRRARRSRTSGRSWTAGARA